MLGKLIKHDFNALARILVPTMLAIVGATILAALGISFNVRAGYSSFGDNSLIQILQTITTLITVIMFVAIFAAFFFIMFVIFQRFYKNFMTSEGYLTFTLPVKTSHLLWSKLITAMIWSVISTLVGILCLFIFLLFATGGENFINAEILTGIGRGLRELSAIYTGGITVIIIEIILFLLVASISSIMQIYLALVIGGAVTQKHKVLAGIGFYFAINTATSIVSTIIQVPVLNSISKTVSSGLYTGNGNFTSYSVQESINAVVSIFQPYFWVLIGFMLLFSAAYFILSHYFLKNKLNLQ